MDNSSFINEATVDTFQQLVIDASFQQPVLVDFWADWCQPCKTLMPILSDLAGEYMGKFHLVKVNTDHHQDLAMQYQVRSLPTVKVFHHGAVVDEFMGAQPEPAIRELLGKYIVNERFEDLLKAQEFLNNGQYTEAETITREIMTQQPDNTDAFVMFLQSQMGLEKIEVVEQQLAILPSHMLEDERIQDIAITIKKTKARNEAGDLAELKQAYENDPDDSDAMLKFANASLAYGENVQGLDLLIRLMRKDPDFENGAAKQALLDAFELLGTADPLVKTYRNKMFALMH